MQLLDKVGSDISDIQSIWNDVYKNSKHESSWILSEKSDDRGNEDRRNGVKENFISLMHTFYWYWNTETLNYSIF